MKGQVRVKLIELPLAIAGIGAAELQSGRLPEAGRNEVLAGARIEPRETLIVGGQSLKVVGVLKPDLALFATSFLVPPKDSTDATNKLFPAVVPSVLHAWLVRASAEELRDEKFRKATGGGLSPREIRLGHPPGPARASDLLSVSVGPGDFASGRLRCAHRPVSLAGGQGRIARCRTGRKHGNRGAQRSRRRQGRLALSCRAAPGNEGQTSAGLGRAPGLLRARDRRLATRSTSMPDVQVVLLGKVGEALATKSNPLGVAGEAYLSGNIPRAAAVTFVINFLLGSLAMITLPSILLPGSGVFLAGIRATAWGLLLAPAMQPLAYAMLPHSGTMLLEGEGYILATLFGLLIPIHIVQSSLGGNPLTRFGRVLLLNLKANFWIALVLAVAAIYEATEVII